MRIDMFLVCLALLVPACVETKIIPMMEFVWEVTESTLQLEKNGNRIYSPVVTTYNGTKEQLWNSVLYPDGLEICDVSHIGLYLCYFGFEEVKIQYEFYMINNVSEKFGYGISTDVFTYGQCNGHRRFLHKRRIEKEGYLFDGKVVVGLKIQSNPVPLMRGTQKSVVLKDFIWDVNLEDFKKKRSQAVIESSEFKTYNQTVEQKWNLMVIPRGHIANNQEFVSIYVCYRSKTPIRTFLETHILKQSSDKHTHGFLWVDFGGRDGLDCKGVVEFIARDRILKASNGFLFEDSIKVGVSLLTDLPAEEVNKDSGFVALTEVITTVTVTNVTDATLKTKVFDV